MYRDRDFDLERTLPAHAETLVDDLELNTLFNAMAGGDEFVLRVAKQAVLSGLRDGEETILYRQGILRDCLRNYAVVKSVSGLAVETIENRKRTWLGIITSHPGGVLYSAVELLQMYMEALGKLRRIADEHSAVFESEGFAAFFALLKAELTDEYFARVKKQLEELKFRDGVLVSAGLGRGNEGTNYVLRKAATRNSVWQRWIDGFRSDPFTIRISDRDEAGARAVSELRDRAIHLVANAVGQSADHVLNFFVMLRTELAFYLGCVNLHRRLTEKGEPVSYPVPAPIHTRKHSCEGLYDVCLTLSLDQKVVGNSLHADGKNLAIITGANRGGKSTFLRAIGLAQLMMQCGMFVGAESFRANLCRGLFTHYKREEDATMKSGKFDEELKRMSEIVDALEPDALVLFNESFAATNEREGSEIARQIVQALADAGVKIFFVTHQYAFAHRAYDDGTDDIIFLRAEREGNGHRSFKLTPGEPLPTSFGVDLYQEIFESTDKNSGLAAALW